MSYRVSTMVLHALRDACVDDADDEAICLAKTAAAADIIRRDMCGLHTGFDGSFPPGCQEHAVPKALVALVSMIMDGLNIKKRDTDDIRQATLCLAQLLQYNRPYSRCQSLKPSLVFLNRASYGRRRNNDVTSQEREVTMMLRHNLRTDAQICGKSATQASLFVRHGRGVNRVYSYIRRRLGSTGSHHSFSKHRKTPLPVYIGMMVRGHTRKRELVDFSFNLGLSISYDRVLDISMGMAIAAAQQYESDEVVCPLILRENLFTTAAVDNIDHNPSWATAHDAFHGIGTSLFSKYGYRA